jgi:hypothetical protein
LTEVEGSRPVPVFAVALLVVEDTWTGAEVWVRKMNPTASPMTAKATKATARADIPRLPRGFLADRVKLTKKLHSL